ncbi:MAG: bifunctional riboflavin kinase/FAD synthetase [Clostridiales bacterium]|nr:bifunctional riboflavin kinase/FAD synthetase [Clostridiales bacterium]
MQSEKKAIALGCFDGLHRGHIAVINAALSYKGEGMAPSVLLFDEHPQKIIRGAAPLEILSDEMKIREIERLGAQPIIISFREIFELSPTEFVEDCLVSRLNAGALCCGYNYRFGKGGGGDTEMLKRLCQKQLIELNISPKVIYKSEPVSSTRIRRAIGSGNIEEANLMLGREFSYNFAVASGDRIGRLIGSPTINQFFPKDFVVPGFGVYASKTLVEGKWYTSVTNIGIRPSFKSDELRSETCILDFSGDLYGQNINVCLLKFLREEKRFSSLEELSAQIKRDAQAARAAAEE